MATRYTNLGAKETNVHCFMPTYAPQLRILSSAPSREVPAFQASGTPGGGPGMRVGMPHAPPTQPPTPPTSQDIKQAPAHLAPQSHPMHPQSGGQMMSYTMTGAGRNNGQQAQYYAAQRGPSGIQRVTTHPRGPMIMSNNPPAYVQQPVYQSSLVPSGQPQMIVAHNMNQISFQNQPRHQSSFYQQPSYMIPQSHHLYPGSYSPMYFAPPIQPMSRPGGLAPNPQAAAPHPQSAGMAILTGTTGNMVSPPSASTKLATRRVPVIDPTNGRDVLKDFVMNNNTPPKSGESSASQTPQPNPDQKADQGVAAEFATKVALAVKSDQSGSPNSPAMQQQPPPSRASNFTENESQASPDMQGMSAPSVSPSKLDISVESISSESQVVENNMAYDGSQQVPMIRPGWPQVELMQVSNYTGLIMPDEMMRSGAPATQLGREYQPMQTQWIPDTSSVPVSVIISSKEPSAPLESPARPGPERHTPVVSALTRGPTVDIAPRQPREQFPPSGKSHQQPSPVKRKQKSETSQEQVEAKGRDVQQTPQPQQPKSAIQQQKPKQTPATVESKKQSLPPSQDSDAYVQSVETKNSESKSIPIKVNEADSSESKTKSNDSLINKENNNLETRNLNEEIVEQDKNNRNNKSEAVKSEVVLPAENISTPRTEDSSGKNCAEAEKAKEVAPSEEKIEPKADAAPAATDLSEAKWANKANGEHSALTEQTGHIEVPAAVTETVSKANGENAADDAKQNNQKQKSGNKRQSQSKMRLEKEACNPEQAEPMSNEVTPAPAPAAPKAKSPPPPQPAVAVDGEHSEQTQLQEDEDKEKEQLIVAAKNEENNKQSASLKPNDTNNSPVIENIKVDQKRYKKDQCSPLNPEGEKKYDRDFIMKLRYDDLSKQKPLNLPSLDLLKDNTKQRPSDRSFSMSAMYGDSADSSLFLPFGNKGSLQRSSQVLPKKGSQTSKPKAAKPHIIHMSLHQDVKLHETENAWKSTRNSKYNNMTEEEIKTEELYKRVRGILNKLTPEKFSTLVEQLQVLPIDNHERLKGVIDLVFEKAVDEPSFSVAYAQMCEKIQNIQVPSDKLDKDGKPTMTSFKKMLITRCQNEFEKDMSAEMKRKEEKLKEIDQETDPEKKKLLQLQFEEEERRIRMKSVGNSRFIGELYKLKMLTCNIMYQCIARLLGEGDEESLECLCKLLTTVGEGLDNKVVKNPHQDLNDCFKKLADIIKNKGSKKVSSRVRFMIQDLIDLRSKKWVPRRDDSNPKTMEEIQKDEDKKNMEINLALNASQERSKRQDSRNSVDNRKRGGEADSLGWKTVSNRNRYIIESSKLRLDHNDVEVSLGNRYQFQNWGQNVGGVKTDVKKMPQMSSNMFAVLNDKTSQPSSRNSSFKGSSISDKDRMHSSYKSSYDDDGRSSRGGSQQGPDSRSSSRDSASSKHDDRREMNVSNKGHAPHKSSSIGYNAPAETKASEEMLQRSANLLLKEYLDSRDINEAELCANDILEQTTAVDLVVYVSREAMELSGSEPKRTVGKIMNYLLKKKRINKEDLLVGLSGVLESADDLALDLPLIWHYIAEIMVDIFAEENLLFRDLAELLKPRQGTTNAANLLARFFSLLVKEKSEAWVKERWTSSKILLSDMIKEENIEDFAKKNKLEFFIESAKMDNIKHELKIMITSRKNCDAVTNWIDKNVSSEIKSTPEFVRTVMTVLLEATVIQTGHENPPYKFDSEYFSEYGNLIVKYIDHEEELELPCLYAIQAFIKKLSFPAGLVSKICDFLWESGLIACESFMNWLETNQPLEADGHAVCVKSLRPFIISLTESMSDDDS